MRTTHQKFNHTNHSTKRASQLGINDNVISTIIKDGDTIHKQGLRFQYVQRDQLDYYKTDFRDRLENVVVVLAGDSDTVITCYKNRDAVKKIRRKPKRLL